MSSGADAVQQAIAQAQAQQADAVQQAIFKAEFEQARLAEQAPHRSLLDTLFGCTHFADEELTLASEYQDPFAGLEPLATGRVAE